MTALGDRRAIEAKNDTMLMMANAAPDAKVERRSRAAILVVASSESAIGFGSVCSHNSRLAYDSSHWSSTPVVVGAIGLLQDTC